MTEALICALFGAGLSVFGAVLCAAEWFAVRAGLVVDDPSPRVPEDDR